MRTLRLGSLIAILFAPACGTDEVVLQYPSPAAREVTHAWLSCSGGAGPHCAEAFARMEQSHHAEQADTAIALAVDEALGGGGDEEIHQVFYDAAIVALASGDRTAAGRFLDVALQHHLDPALAARLGNSEPAGLHPPDPPRPQYAVLLARIEGARPGAAPPPPSASSAPQPPSGGATTVTVGGFTFPLKCTGPMTLDGLNVEIAEAYRAITVEKGCDLTISNSTLVDTYHSTSNPMHLPGSAIHVLSGGKLHVVHSTVHLVGDGVSVEVEREGAVSLDGAVMDGLIGSNTNRQLYGAGRVEAKGSQLTRLDAGTMDVSVEQSSVTYVHCDAEAHLSLSHVTASRVGSTCALSMADCTIQGPKDLTAVAIAGGTAKITGTSFVCPKECVDATDGSFEVRGSRISASEQGFDVRGSSTRGVMSDVTCDDVSLCLEVRNGASLEASGMKITGKRGVLVRDKGHLVLAKSDVNVKNTAVTGEDHGLGDVTDCTLQGRIGVGSTDSAAIHVKRGTATGSESALYAGWKGSIDAEGVRATGPVKSSADAPVNVH